MNSLIDNGENFKQQYMAIQVPKALDNAIYRGLERGSKNKRRRIVKQYVLSAATFFILVMVSLAVTINLSPSFANSLADVPVLGRIVKLLQFVDGKASGGSINDGVDINNLEVVETYGTESFVIHFAKGNETLSELSAFEIHRYEKPNTIQFDMGGVRMLSASEDFGTIRRLKLVKDVYRLMTLDDSLVRFQVVLEDNVEVEVGHLSNPEGLLVTLSRQDNPINVSDEIFTVRTKSFPFSEAFGHLEEDLFWKQKEGLIQAYRIMRDSEGGFLYEFEQFNTQEAAETYLTTLEGKISMDLIIESRLPSDLPGYIGE